MPRVCGSIAGVGAIVALALVGAGCGGGGGGDQKPAPVAPARFGHLLARLPPPERYPLALDVGGARRELGLRDDAAPPAGGAYGNDGERRLRGLVAATVLNYPIKDNGPLD